MLSSIAYRLSICLSGCSLMVLTLFSAISSSNPAIAQEESPKKKGNPTTVNLDPAVLAKSLEELVKGLDSNKLNERDATEAKIIALGPQVIELLPPVSDDISGEMQMRIDRIRSTLEKEMALNLAESSLVTLKGQMTGLEALTRISEMTENKIELSENPALRNIVLAAFDETPFWEAVDEVLDQVGQTIAPEDGLDFQLSDRAPGAPLRIEASSYSGVFRMAPVAVSKYSDLIDPANNSLNLSILIAWEPRINPSLITFDVEDLEVLCDNGEILTPISKEPISFAPISGCQTVISLDLNLPTRGAESIKKLTGSMDVTVPGKMASVAFTDVGKTVDKTLANGMLSVTLLKTRKNRNVYEILLGVAVKDYDESPNSIEGWASLQDAYLFDKQLNRVENIGWSTTHVGEKEYGLSYVFDIEGGLEGCRFVFRGPGSLKRQRLEFEVLSTPLP